MIWTITTFYENGSWGVKGVNDSGKVEFSIPAKFESEIHAQQEGLDWTKRWEDSLGPDGDAPQAPIVGSIVEAQGGEITSVIQEATEPVAPVEEPPAPEPTPEPNPSPVQGIV